ncbi:hypothetical protein GCK72_005318 [Caenorhabditis remanei]|uniref:F-box domain-containing protein n=2 Tax=Caenorhabditis remanei TaxID=31234 RepID=E3LF65_CAERE|nr:hypothetical protein GCK72_005318 [Caenorhabditis remanei]EFO86063.1 hypothetical protein CRE_01732 [Caenorhabditis remanei]KAF1765366.1 hypothetical protein GCK72_005318 [Caenorhabditis remanei]
MFRQTEPIVRSLTRKRKNIESTPPITDYFTTIKRDRSQTEAKKDVSQKLDEKLDDTCARSTPDYTEHAPLFSLEDLRILLKVPLKPSLTDIPDESLSVGLENLPGKIYSHIFTILDMQSVTALSLASTKMSSRVRCYVSTHDFYRRMQLDHLDFLNESFRPDDDEFFENDPFVACGALIKSITITLNTETRARVFLNICRNLRNQLGGSLQGFGRMLETVTDNWKFSERRIMIKAAILIDPDLRRALIKVLTAKPGQCIGLEMKVRSGLTQLFLTKNQDVDEITPQEVISFGSWLSIVIRNVVEKYQGKLYFILFGPTRSSSTGELVDWTYFCDEETQKHSIRKCEPNYKKLLKTLLNGIRALRIMNNSKSSDDWWTGQKIYQLFLRIIEACGQERWSIKASSMSLSIDSPGLLSEYLVNCLDPQRSDYQSLLTEAAEMVCLVRSHLYRWSSTPATYLAEPLHHAFNHLAQSDGHYEGGYKSFLDKIWKVQQIRLKELVKNAKNTTQASNRIREELDGQLAMARLLCEFATTISLHNQHAIQLPQDVGDEIINEPREEDEQLEEI